MQPGDKIEIARVHYFARLETTWIPATVATVTRFVVMAYREGSQRAEAFLISDHGRTWRRAAQDSSEDAALAAVLDATDTDRVIVRRRRDGTIHVQRWATFGFFVPRIFKKSRK